MALKRAGTLLFYTTIQPPLTCASPRATYNTWRRRDRYRDAKSAANGAFSRQDCRIGYGRPQDPVKRPFWL